MTFVRPVASADLDALLALAGEAGVGLTTLPKDRDLLSRRIEASERSITHEPLSPGTETYLFVMEDAASGRVVGACGVAAKVGGFQPFYAYAIEESLFESKVLGVHKQVPILRLLEEHDGPCEIGSLFLHKDFRGKGQGRFLQLVRFLFMAEHPHRFESTVVSEIRGICTEDGHSPFWDAIGAHFFDIDFAEADRLSIVNKKFIADLMPDHPIYIQMLPYSAQEVIGKPHPHSARAVNNLEGEGFYFCGQVDIFDAGPVFACARDDVRSIRDSKRGKVAKIVDELIEGPLYLISNTRIDFRACATAIATVGDDVWLTREAASVLQVEPGDSVRSVPLY